MKNKSSRQDIILNLVTQNRIHSQEELAAMLSKMGMEVTQATLSRDLKELKLVKVIDENGYYYRHQSSLASRTSSVNRSGHIADGIYTIEFAGNLAVIKTEPGFASVISSIIDKGVTLNLVMGTISGDDTLLVVFRKPEVVDEVMEVLSHLLPGIEKKLIKF